MITKMTNIEYKCANHAVLAFCRLRLVEEEEEASPPAPDWAFILSVTILCDRDEFQNLNRQAAYHLVHLFPLTASTPEACQGHTFSRPTSQYSKISLLQRDPLSFYTEAGWEWQNTETVSEE